MYDSDTRHLDGAEISDDVMLCLDNIESCDSIMWSARDGTYDVELTMKGGAYLQLELDQDELDFLCDREPLVAAEAGDFQPMSDAAERECERRQMGISDL